MKRTFWCTEKHNTTHEHKDQTPFHLLNTVLVKLRKISTRLVTCTFCGTQFNPGEIPRLLRLLPSSRYYSHCLTHFLCSLCHSALPLMTLPDIKLALVHCGGREREMLSNLLNISHSLLTHTHLHVCSFIHPVSPVWLERKGQGVQECFCPPVCADDPPDCLHTFSLWIHKNVLFPLSLKKRLLVVTWAC